MNFRCVSVIAAAFTLTILLSGCGNSADSGAAPAADDGNPGFSDADDTGSNAVTENSSLSHSSVLLSKGTGPS